MPYSSASRKKPKRERGFFLGHAQRTKDLALNVLAMNTDRARTQFGAIQHHVISQRADFAQRRLGVAVESKLVSSLAMSSSCSEVKG